MVDGRAYLSTKVKHLTSGKVSHNLIRSFELKGSKNQSRRALSVKSDEGRSQH